MAAAILILLTALARTPLPASPQEPGGERPAVVSGRVVDAATGRPVAGAVVMPFGSAAAPAPGDAAGAPARVLSNAGGHYVIRGVHAGMLYLLASKGGYIDAAHAQRRPGGSGQMIPIAPGQRIVDVEIRMWRHGVITGTVLDEAAEPVIGARVQAYRSQFVSGRRYFAASGSATTDDRGVYRIPQLLPGDYIVAVPSKQTSIPADVMDVFFAGASSRAARDDLGRELSTIGAAVAPAGSRYTMAVETTTVPLPPGTATPTARANGGLLVYPTVFYPAAPAAAQATVVAVRSGEETGSIDLRLQPARAARVSGSLIAPEGMAGHVAVRLLAAGNDALDSDREAAATITDTAGAFTFVGVPPGQYLLSVVRVPRPPADPGDANRMRVTAGSTAISPAAPPPPGPPPPPPPVPADATLWAQVPLAVAAEDLNGLVVPLGAAARMSGRVEFDGVAEPPDPSALANLAITLEPADGSPAPPGLRSQAGHPDGSGAFRTLGVPPGHYLVNVTGPALRGWFFKGATFQGRDVADVPVDMTHADVAGVVLTFTDRPAAITGTVRSNGAVDGESIVLAYPSDAAAWSSSGARARRMRVARPARDGTYALPNLAAGEYYVIAVKEDNLADWQDPAVLRAFARTAERVRVLDGEQKGVDLRTVTAR